MKRFLILAITAIALAFLFNACGSRALNTAKNAYTNGDFDKAIENLNQELAVNPSNGEAWMMLIDIYVKKGDKVAAFKATQKASENITDPKYISLPAQKIYSFWLEAFNNGVSNLTKFIETKDKANFDEALKNFDMGIAMRPQILQFYSYKISLLELNNDFAAAEVTKGEYLAQLQKYADFATKTGVHLDAKSSVIKAKFGKAIESQTLPADKDSIYAEAYTYDNKVVSVFYQDVKKTGDPVVVYWKPEIPKNWDPREKFQYLEMEINPLGNFAQKSFDKKDYDNALEYLKMFQIFDPHNTSNTVAIFKIYQEAGKLEEAKTSLDELIKNDPKNVMAYTQYGDLYANTKFEPSTPTNKIIETYDKAISMYEKALAIDPNYSFALRNVAAIYKNKAVIYQKEQIEKIEANPKYVENVEAYFPFLRKSAENFEKITKSPEFRNDFVLFGELAEIYLVLDEKAKLDKIMVEIDSFNTGLKFESKEVREQYLLMALRIYGKLKNTTKLQEIEKQLKNL